MKTYLDESELILWFHLKFFLNKLFCEWNCANTVLIFQTKNTDLIYLGEFNASYYLLFRCLHSEVNHFIFVFSRVTLDHPIFSVCFDCNLFWTHPPSKSNCNWYFHRLNALKGRKYFIKGQTSNGSLYNSHLKQPRNCYLNLTIISKLKSKKLCKDLLRRFNEMLQTTNIELSYISKM